MVLISVLLQLCALFSSENAEMSLLSIVEDYPWFAGLMTKEGKPRCSGTLVSASHVLTASACIITRRNGSWEALDPDDFLVFIPSATTERIKAVSRFVSHPFCLTLPRYFVGVIKFFMSRHCTYKVNPVLPLWSANRSSLHDALNYVFENAESFTCTVVTWDRRPYKRITGVGKKMSVRINEVTLMSVRPIEFETCSKMICQNNSTDCKKRMKGLFCADIINPPNAYFSDASRGAGLSCARFFWGVLIGGTSIDSNFSILTQIDSIVDFMNKDIGDLLTRSALSLSNSLLIFIAPQNTIGCWLILQMLVP